MSNGTPNGRPWPKISIITPNYNYGQFIEETIRSVLLQGYPNLEFIVIDGASTDNSVEKIKKYEKWISYWISKKDSGQASAINKGLKLCSGDLVNWINSDDLLARGCMASLGRLNSDYPNKIVAGACKNFSSAGHDVIIINSNLSPKNLVTCWRNDYTYQQPATFIPSKAIKSVGYLDESFNFCFDHEWLIRLTRHCDVIYTNDIFAEFRLHELSKTVAQQDLFFGERLKLSKKHWKKDAELKKSNEFKIFFLAVILNDKSGKGKKLFQIFMMVISDFKVLSLRNTWGAIKRIIFGRMKSK